MHYQQLRLTLPVLDDRLDFADWSHAHQRVQPRLPFFRIIRIVLSPIIAVPLTGFYQRRFVQSRVDPSRNIYVRRKADRQHSYCAIRLP
jgi:hypothetical protein